jgi:hypothetical protein
MDGRGTQNINIKINTKLNTTDGIIEARGTKANLDSGAKGPYNFMGPVWYQVIKDSGIFQTARKRWRELSGCNHHQ